MEHDCHVDLIHKLYDEKDVSEISRADLVVSGMGCYNCAMRVRNAILQLDGVNWVDVKLETGRAQVAYNVTKISPKQFLPAVATADPEGRRHYQAELIPLDTDDNS
ncbi:MAG: heavy-metal-associated domain-containing protein [Anaerolineales bacterium]